MISKETIDRILSAVSLVDVIGDYVKLTKKGSNYVGCCPFHAEKTASFVVNASKNIYKCFGCSAAGNNAASFIQAHEQVSFPEAMRLLSKRTGIEIVEQQSLTDEEKEKYARRETLRAVVKKASELFIEQLDATATAYLASRGFSAESVERFGLGYAGEGWQTLLSALKKAGFKDDEILSSSLATKTEKGVFDYFRNRVLFPIREVSGSIAGFTGRSIEATAHAKYLNSKDTEIFNKGKLLYGLFEAKRFIVQNDMCNLVEGNFDVIRWHELGVANTVAACGTALTKEQIQLIRRFTPNVTVVYDGDAAGIQASFRNIDLLLAEGMNVWAVALPSGTDPDDYGRAHGREGVLRLLGRKVNFIQFRYEFLKAQSGNDPILMADCVNQVIHSIGLIPDAAVKESYKRLCADTFGFTSEQLARISPKALPPTEEPDDNGWLGLSYAKEAIAQEQECRLVGDYAAFLEEQLAGYENTITFKGKLGYSYIQQLGALTRTVVLPDGFSTRDIVDANGREPELVHIAKKLVDYDIEVQTYIRSEYYDDTHLTSFLDAYCKLNALRLEENIGNDTLRMQCIERVAEMLAKADNIQQALYADDFAKKVGIKPSDFKKIMKPHSEKQNTSMRFKQESIVSDGQVFDFNPGKLPEYVDHAFFQKYGFFAAQNKAGKPIFYVFKTEQGGLLPVSTFYIDPLFHVWDEDPKYNKRVVQINNINGNSFFMEIPSNAMINFAEFRQVMWAMGSNVFTRGKAQHHELIIASIADRFPKCYELKVFGQQHEDFYAFSNAIVTAGGEVIHMNNLGLVNYKDIMYYSPSVSQIYAGNRQDNDKYRNDRWFIYRENSETDFETWAKLMLKVYKMNDNGYWALLFAILSAFRSVIYPNDRLFTGLFFVGPTESGKSQIAISARALFMSPEAPLFNLTTGTDAAFFALLERIRDAIQVFEEYNNKHISDAKFQGLKASIYDGDGRQKKKDTSSKDIEVSEVNSAIIILGQENAERDDNALPNRCIVCHVPKKDNWTEEEDNAFRELKRRQSNGLTNILIDVLRQRPVIRQHYLKEQRAAFKELRDDLRADGSTANTRIMNTVSLFLGLVRVWEQHVPGLHLPFTYKEFYKIARTKVVTQSESIGQTNRLSVFFETIQLLLSREHNGLVPGRELKIAPARFLTLRTDRVNTEERDLGDERKLLYLRLSLIRPLYASVNGSESLEMNNLMMYIKDHPAYIGETKSTRFSWTEYKDRDDGFGTVRKTPVAAGTTSSATVLDYEVFKQLSGIDLEKYEDNPADDQPRLFDEVDADNGGGAQQGRQGDIPF